MKIFKTISQAVPEVQYEFAFRGSESDCYLNKIDSKVLLFIRITALTI